jgi:hypothetical protein
MLTEANVNELKNEAKHQPVKTDETKLEEVKPEVMDRGCLKPAVSICKSCICCWRFCLNSCQVVMDCNIRCCTCAKGCLERIDCDDTP